MKTKQLHQGWREVELGDVADFLRGPFGSSIKKSVCVPKGLNTYKLYEQGNVIKNDFNRGNYYLTEEKFEELKKFELLPGDIAITCAGTLGKIAIVPKDIEKGIINSVLMRIRLDNLKICQGFFIHLFRSSIIQNYISSQSQGVAVKNLFATKILRKFKIPLPPLPIQKKIVEILEQAEKLKQKREQADKLTDDYLKSVFWEMFLKEKFDEDILKNVVYPNKNSLKRGPFGGSLKKEIFVPEGYKVYEQQNAIYDNCKRGSYYIDSKKFEEMKDFSVKSGDIIISCSGTIGKLSILKDNCPEGIINQALLKISLDNNKIISLFFKFLFNSEFIQNKLFDFSHGSGIKNFPPMKNIRNLKIPLPPLPLQKKFASIVEKVENIKQKQKQSKQEIENLFNALMQRAFRGELI